MLTPLKSSVSLTIAAACLWVAGGNVRAQEVPRPSLARQQQQQTPPADYNIKVGQVLLTADVKVSGQYIDNVYLTPKGESDFAVRPEFGLNIAWQATQLNVLQLRTGISYTKFLNHSDLDSENLELAPNSALTFSIFIGDLKIQLHDTFSLQNDTLSQGSLSGVAKLPRFNNTAGVTFLLDLNDVMWTLGYDHYNFITLGKAVTAQGTSQQDLSQLDHSTEQVSTSVTATVNDAMQIGLEGVYSYSQYPNDPQADYSSFSVGPTFNVQMSKYTAITLDGGFKGYSFQAGPPSLVQDSTGALSIVPGREAGLSTGYYADLSVLHRLNRYYSDRFEIGHEDTADPITGRMESNYVRYRATWNVNSKLSFGLGLFFEQVTSSATPGLGSFQSDYLRWGGNVSTGYKVTKYVSLGLSYEYTKKDADDPTQSYSQNTVSLTLGYIF